MNEICQLHAECEQLQQAMEKSSSVAASMKKEIKRLEVMLVSEQQSKSGQSQAEHDLSG